jgi:hypothetical protein
MTVALAPVIPVAIELIVGSAPTEQGGGATGIYQSRHQQTLAAPVVED